jgi:hypothetical protein
MTITNTLRYGATAAAAIFCLAGGSAHAQLTPNADGHFGSVQLQSGFTPDPRNVELRAGGSYDASNLGSSCRGMIAPRPDYTVRYTAGSFPLRFSATSSTDTTIVVRLPDGSYLCDDDGGGSLNPLVHIREPRNGRYQIWVGTFGNGAGNPDATLHISELELTGGLDWRENPNFGTIRLNAGFRPDPHTVDLRAGGTIDASETSSQCRGFVTRAPDYDLHYSAGAYALSIAVQANSDTTLIINAPNGNWYCNDDANGFNPEVLFDNPQSGLYDIWVGTFSSGASQPAQLRIHETPRPRGK